VLDNHSGRVVNAYDVKLADANGRGIAPAAQVLATPCCRRGFLDGAAIYTQGMVPVNSTVPMPSLVQVRVAGQGPIVTATLRSGIFADGQFVGVGAFEQFTTKLKAIIEVGMLAKTQAWDQVKALAQALSPRPQAPAPEQRRPYLDHSPSASREPRGSNAEIQGRGGR
jgi:hypothetical protein